MARGSSRRQAGRKGQTAKARILSFELAVVREAYDGSAGPSCEELLVKASELVGRIATVSAGMHTRGRNRRGILSVFAESVAIATDNSAQQPTGISPIDPDYTEAALRYNTVPNGTTEVPPVEKTATDELIKP